jgi:Uma2 family endonuclease
MITEVRSPDQHMATTTSLLTWEAFEKFPDDAMHHELIEGELQILPPPKSNYSRIAKRFFLALLTAENERRGEALMEAGFKLSNDPATWIQPDVSFVLSDRISATPEEGYFIGAPALAIEVVSPSESASDLQRKVNLLLRSGGLAVLVIHPRIREVHGYLAHGAPFILGMNDTLTLPALLPDWQLPVAKLFEE